MKRFFTLGAAVWLLVSPAARAEEQTKAIDARNFSKIVVEGVYEIRVTVGPDWSLELKGEPEQLARSNVRVSQGAVRLATNERPRGEKRKRSRDRSVTATLTLPRLESLNVSGVADAEVSGVSADAFTLVLSGVGDIDIKGACGRLEADISGVGDVDASELSCKNVELRLSGVGDATVFASESVDANVSGIGNATVLGSPKSVATAKSMFSDIDVK